MNISCADLYLRFPHLRPLRMIQPTPQSLLEQEMERYRQEFFRLMEEKEKEFHQKVIRSAADFLDKIQKSEPK